MTTTSLPVSPYVERVAQIICNGLYPEALASGKALADFPTATRENLLAIAEAILVEAPRSTHPALEYAWWVTSSPILDELAPAQLLAGQPLDTIDGEPIPVDSHQTAHLEKPWRARLSMLIYALQWDEPRKVIA